jgi:predicted metal-dependent hydrolase
VQRRASVRGLRLTVDPRDATVRLTLATRAPLKPALAWAEGKRDWIEAELARLPIATPIAPGSRFAVVGQDVMVTWLDGGPRTVRLVGDELIVGGPREQIAARVLRFLRTHALRVLEAETRALATRHGISVARVGVGDPKSRWGSCSSRGDIRYSWRLILAPPHVMRSTVAHELAHRVHMNHGPDFHALAARLNGENPAPARAWLRAHGTALHWFGRTG